MSCGKVRYRDRIAAQIALANTRQHRSAKRNEARAYRCPRCRGWHLTSRRK